MLDDEVQERLAQLLPNENPEFTFQTLINWARFGNLLAFDEDSDRSNTSVGNEPQAARVPRILPGVC